MIHRKEIFRGSGVALITPFNNNEEIDFKKLKELVNFHINNNTDSIIVCGTTGEASTMTVKEHLLCIECCVNEAGGKIPIIAGTGSNCTKSAINMSVEAEKLGASALLVVTPYYNKATQNGLVKHYSEIASSVNIPILLYNVPSRTGLNMLPETVIKIMKKNENVYGIKEASGDLVQIRDLMKLAKQEKIKLDLYSGNDDQVYQILELGGIGVISVNANIVPMLTHNLVLTHLKGFKEVSYELQKIATDLSNAIFKEVNPIGIKSAMKMCKMLDNEILRGPLTSMEDKNKIKLRKVLKKNNCI